MNIRSFESFFAFIVYLWMIIFVLSKDSKSLLNKICAVVITCFAIWSFPSIPQSIMIPKNDAMIWLHISSFGWCSFAGFYVWFTLILTKKEKILKKWYFYFLVFIIPVISIYKQWTGYLVCDLQKDLYGWSIVVSTSFWIYLYYTYYALAILISLYLTYRFSRKTRFLHEKKQMKIIIITGLISLILGTFTDVILPQLKISISYFPSASTLILVWAGGMVYAITRYKLMVPTISYAAKDILLTMTDSLILTNPKGEIVEINKATLDMVGHSREEIIGQPAGMLFGEEENFVREDEFISDRRTNYVTKAKEEIPVDLSGSVVKDKTGDIIGMVYISRDIRETIKSEEEKEKLQKQILQSEKTIAVAQLAGGVAHEINNPMGVILGFTQSIVKKMEENNFLYIPLKSIERETIKCKKLIEDLLNFSRG